MDNRSIGEQVTDEIINEQFPTRQMQIDHLKEVQELANKRYNQLMEEFKKRENITEELKQKDQMKWVGLMNNISNCVDEIVLKECIYDD